MKCIAITAFGAALMLAAVQPAAASSHCSRTSTGGIVGALGGAALGGFLGSKIGSGSGQLAATGAGVFLGGFIGNEIGRRMTCEDQYMASNTAQQTLETQPSGTPVAWNNPDSGNRGTITPVRTYQQNNGQYCREYQQTVTVGGDTQDAYGTACRQADGTWLVQQ